MVDAIIERVQTSNTKSARATVVLSFPLAHHGELFMQLAEQTGNAMRVNFEAMSVQMEFGEDPNEGLPEGVEQHWNAPSGEVFGPHAYEADASGLLCGKCGWVQDHASHEMPETVLNMRAVAATTGSVET